MGEVELIYAVDLSQELPRHRSRIASTKIKINLQDREHLQFLQ